MAEQVLPVLKAHACGIEPQRQSPEAMNPAQ